MIIIKALHSLFTGKTTLLNKKIEIFEHEYNEKLLEAYNRGFEDNVIETKVSFEKAVNDISKYYKEVVVTEIDKCRMPPAQKIDTGKRYVNPITNTLDWGYVELREIGYSIILSPVAPSLAVLKDEAVNEPI